MWKVEWWSQGCPNSAICTSKTFDNAVKNFRWVKMRATTVQVVLYRPDGTIADIWGILNK